MLYGTNSRRTPNTKTSSTDITLGNSPSDQMETQIVRKVQQNYERWQVKKVDNFQDQRQETNGEDQLENDLHPGKGGTLYNGLCDGDGSARKKVPFQASE